jgi:hypothetical protein
LKARPSAAVASFNTSTLVEDDPGRLLTPAIADVVVAYQGKISAGCLTTPGNPRKIFDLNQFSNYEQRRIIYVC